MVTNPNLMSQICAMQQQEKSMAYRCTDYIAMTGALVCPSDRATLCIWGYQTLDACPGVSRSIAVHAISFFDRFLSFPSQAARQAPADVLAFQLAFVACLVIALKMHSGFNVESDFVSKIICQDMYSPDEINAMEILVLQVLEWKLTGPTCLDFIDYYVEAMMPIDEIHRKFLTQFSKALAELAITRYSVALKLPSEVAFTAVYCALQYTEPRSRNGFSLLQEISRLNPNDTSSRTIFKTMCFLVYELLCGSVSESREAETRTEGQTSETLSSDTSPMESWSLL